MKAKLAIPFSFSQSSLQDYVDCPQRFQLRYIEQLAWPAVEIEPAHENERRLQEGQLFHRMVQQHLLGLPAEKLGRLAATPDLRRWWENYLVCDLGLLGYAQFTELALSTTLGNHRLVAKYDLIAVQPSGKAIIFDWKTFRRRPRDEWMAARLQTRVYPALLVQAGAHLNNGSPFPPEQVEMIYWYADFPSKPARFPYDEAQYKRDWDALTQLAAEITAQGADFPKTEDEKACRFCPYRSFCERGAQAGSMEEAEAEMEAAAEGFNLNFEQIAEIEF